MANQVILEINMIDRSDLPQEVIKKVKESLYHEEFILDATEKYIVAKPLLKEHYLLGIGEVAKFADGMVLTWKDDMDFYDRRKIYVSFKGDWHRVARFNTCEYDKMITIDFLGKMIDKVREECSREEIINNLESVIDMVRSFDVLHKTDEEKKKEDEMDKEGMQEWIKNSKGIDEI